MNFLKSELDKVNQLLRSYYSMNILPNTYRNLASVYYIYDYMSSSQENLQDTLLHEHMENGIQRILAKLDTIISQNQELIFRTHILEANSKEMINHNKEMLRSLNQTQLNTADAAKYAELGANYSAATAYFSLANYLNNKYNK